jgi:hypothetical protein
LIVRQFLAEVPAQAFEYVGVLESGPTVEFSAHDQVPQHVRGRGTRWRFLLHAALLFVIFVFQHAPQEILDERQRLGK